MTEDDRKKANRTISHNLDDDLRTTLGERLAAQEQGDGTRPAPRAPEQVAEEDVAADTGAPAAPDEGARR